MQGSQVDGTIRIGRLKVEQFLDTCTIVAPRSAGWHEFGVFYILVLLSVRFPFFPTAEVNLGFIYFVPAIVGVCRSTIRHVITINGSRIFVRREVFGICWHADAYLLEHSAKLRFVSPGHGRRYSRPNVLAITYRGKQRCFAPSITALEAADLLALLRTQLPMWFQEI